MSILQYHGIVGATLLPNLPAMPLGCLARKSIETWYKDLKKPEWTPPNWSFGVAWTAIYSSIGYASYLVVRDAGGFENAKLPLILYGSNLAFNYAWTPIFFNAKKIDLAFFDINLVNATAAATAYLFYKVNPVAGYLFIPYILWLGYATALNYKILKDNPEYTVNIKEIKEK